MENGKSTYLPNAERFRIPLGQENSIRSRKRVVISFLNLASQNEKPMPYIFPITMWKLCAFYFAYFGVGLNNKQIIKSIDGLAQHLQRRAVLCGLFQMRLLETREMPLQIFHVVVKRWLNGKLYIVGITY